MTHKQIEAYRYFKNLHPDGILLFRVGNQFVALFDDAIKVSESLTDHPEVVNDMVSFNNDDVLSISAIGEYYQIRFFGWRNEFGELDIPDVVTIKKEKEDDY